MSASILVQTPAAQAEFVQIPAIQLEVSIHGRPSGGWLPRMPAMFQARGRC
jgi:hypothetical protein